VTYRLVAGAAADLRRIIIESGRKWGIDAAVRYDLLIRTVLSTVANDPTVVGSYDMPDVPGMRAYPLRIARRKLAIELRVGEPRHIVVYRVGRDGVVEVLGLAHDRMLLSRAARRMKRGASRPDC
jgi:toxin ParE1/3/4